MQSSTPTFETITSRNPNNNINLTNMMQPSSIFEAIKNDDFEGLLSLYATTVYDSVHSAEFAARICGSYDETTDKDMSSILTPTLQGGRKDSERSSRDVDMFLDGEMFVVVCSF